MDRAKRELRELKREIKRAGKKRVRRLWKRDLVERPEEAPHSEPDYGRLRSADLNGMDRDATRARPGPSEGIESSREPE